MRAEERRASAIAWYATLALPAAAVLAVGYAVMVAGKPRPVFAARIRGGPTEGARTLSFRLEAVEHSHDYERGLAGRRLELEATLATGTKLRWEGDLNDEGAADVSLAPPEAVTGPVRVKATLGANDGEPRESHPNVLIDDVLNLSARQWYAASKRRGGWVEGHSPRPLSIRVAAGRGVFAVPFRDPLIVEARRAGEPLPGVAIHASSEGADLTPNDTVTDGQGRVTLGLRPREHAISVAIRARATTGEDAELDAAIAVVPGALRATLSNGSLVIDSPIARDRAYVTLVGDHERLLGRTVSLSPDGQGSAQGSLAVPELDRQPPSSEHPLWAVVSSEPDQRSASLVGWPLVSPVQGPQSTFDVPDVLMADGVGAALSREGERIDRIRLAGASVAVAILSLAGALLVLRARRAERTLAAHIDESLSDAETTMRLVDKGAGRGWVLIAVVCVALGAALIAAFAVWK